MLKTANKDDWTGLVYIYNYINVISQQDTEDDQSASVKNANTDFYQNNPIPL